MQCVGSRAGGPLSLLLLDWHEPHCRALNCVGWFVARILAHCILFVLLCAHLLLSLLLDFTCQWGSVSDPLLEFLREWAWVPCGGSASAWQPHLVLHPLDTSDWHPACVGPLWPPFQSLESAPCSLPFLSWLLAQVPTLVSCSVPSCRRRCDLCL